MTRTERQHNILQKWINNKGIGTVIAATGFGKTYLGILSAQKILEKYPDGDIIVVVPRIPLKEEWSKAFQRAGISNYKIYVVNTAVKKIKEHGKLSCTHKIFDEGHRYMSGREFPKVRSGIKSKTALFLTAHIESEPPFPILEKVGKEECLKNGWVADHEVYNLAVPLTEEEQIEFEKINNNFKYYESILGGKFNAFSNAAGYRKFISIKKEPENFLINKYTNRVFRKKDLYKRLEDPNDGFDREALSKFRSLTDNEIEKCYSKGRSSIVYYQEMNKRKKLLCNSLNKVEAIKEITNKFPDRKGVVFSEHTNFADLVYQNLEDSYIYHSNRTDKQNREALQAFRDSNSGIMASARSLNEGVDIPDCSLGIAAAGNSKELDNIQREGRIIRKQDNKRALFINLYVPETQDEKWLNKRQKDDALYVNSVNEILEYEELAEKAGGSQ